MRIRTVDIQRDRSTGTCRISLSPLSGDVYADEERTPSQNGWFHFDPAKTTPVAAAEALRKAMVFHMEADIERIQLHIDAINALKIDEETFV